ncbi:Ig-like domain repeat protein, partial [Paenibacillus daejeonensis]|uniref:Ig-like domain repeat protein n=1 Tax=Paenibacillus daejeonensis TaxID=135193 RepID=UPI0003623DBA
MKKGWLVFISLILAIESLLVPPGAAAAGLAFTSVSSQADTSVALDTEGEIYAWGSNWNGQFGNGTSAGSAEPQRIEVLEHGLPVTFREVKTGRSHSLALDTDGQIWSTGDNGYGQLGKGHFDASLSWSKLVITDEGAEVSFSTIAAGWGSSYAIDDNGELWGWGLRISSTMPQRTAIPTKLGLTDGGSPVQFQSIANNNEQAIGIDSSNHLWQIALVGDQTQKFNLTDDGTTPQFQSVAVGAGYGNGGFLALALETDGDLWIWGSNDHGQLGDSGVEDETRWLPEKLTVLDHGSPVLFSKIAGGNHHALALDTNGNLWAWGKNDQGQLGNGSTAGNGPVKVTTEDNGNPTRFTSITAGFEKSYALDAEGRIWAWGYSYGLMPSRFPAGVSPTVTLAVSQTSSTYLEEVTLTANVSGVWGMPTGTVEFRDGTHVLGNRALSGGTAELDLSTLSAGPHHLTVHYSGDVTYSALASEILDYTVDMPGAPALTLTPSTTADTFDPVTIAVDVQIEGTGNTLDSLKWLAGSRAAEDFAGAGTDILGSRSFEAASSGIYTAYARDAAGSETVETIELNNILAAGDAAGLNAAIAAAGQALAEHPEGSGVGEAPAAARSTLQAAIGAAQAVA